MLLHNTIFVQNSVQCVSVVRRSEALGYVLPVPNYDIYAESA
jgi:hypothetical protein